MNDEKHGTRVSCTCARCQAACTTKPGWFLPGEAEKVAAYLGISLQELFETKLGVDWWEGDPAIFLLSPAITTHPSGEEFPSDPRGRCAFHTREGRCAIHPVKPFECASFIHDAPEREVSLRHKAVALAWRDHQDQIRGLLGREPVSSSFSWLDAWGARDEERGEG